MGLMQNISMIEARQAYNMARGIAVAFGSSETVEQIVYAMTGDEKAAFKARMNIEHRKAVSQ